MKERSQTCQIYVIEFMSRMCSMLAAITFTISVMVSNFGFGRQQVPCYSSEFMAFKCYFCHVFVMYSYNT